MQRNTVHRARREFFIPAPKIPQTQPHVLSRAEVVRLLRQVEQRRDRALLMTTRIRGAFEISGGVGGSGQRPIISSYVNYPFCPGYPHERCENCLFYLNPDEDIAYCWHPKIRILVGESWWCQWWETIPQDG